MELEEPVDRRHVAFGVIVMAVGLLFLMDQLEIVQQAVLGLLWPGVFIAWGFKRIVWPPRPGGRSEAFDCPDRGLADARSTPPSSAALSRGRSS
jgi:hypothetical protein